MRKEAIFDQIDSLTKFDTYNDSSNFMDATRVPDHQTFLRNSWFFNYFYKIEFVIPFYWKTYTLRAWMDRGRSIH